MKSTAISAFSSVCDSIGSGASSSVEVVSTNSEVSIEVEFVRGDELQAKSAEIMIIRIMCLMAEVAYNGHGYEQLRDLALSFASTRQAENSCGIFRISL
ncbi:MAG: hypothetical protein WBA74_12305 [Cyclobacteriaceae bacterium]